MADDNFIVGKNEKYLITKLKSYNISLEKIDAYLYKLKNGGIKNGAKEPLNMDLYSQ